MSQFFINGVTSGNIPPNIPTSFVTDSGTAIPSANILDVNGQNGITTTGSGNDLVVKFMGGTTSTAGAVSSLVVIDSNVTNNNTTTYQILIDGFDSVLNEAVGGQIIGTVKNVAGVVTVSGTPDVIKNGDPTANLADYTIISSGGNVAVQFTGVVGTNIAWNAIIAGKTR